MAKSKLSIPKKATSAPAPKGKKKDTFVGQLAAFRRGEFKKVKQKTDRKLFDWREDVAVRPADFPKPERRARLDLHEVKAEIHQEMKKYRKA